MARRTRFLSAWSVTLVLTLFVAILCSPLDLARGEVSATSESACEADPTLHGIDGNGDGSVDLSDAVYLLNWLFASGPIPQTCLGEELAACESALETATPRFPNGRFVVHGNGLVTDTSTGLMWQQSTFNFPGDGDERVSWDTAVTFPETLSLGGFDDWRLPTIEELSTIIEFENAFPAARESVFGIGTLTTKYWSSTTSLVDGRTAFAVEFGQLGTITRESKPSEFYARFVRTVESTPARFPVCIGNDDRFVEDGNGLVTDTCTGLMWQQNTVNFPGDGDELVKWETAFNFAADLSLGGHDDWRLPTVEELLTIVDYTRTHPASEPIFGVGVLHNLYWSATTDPVHLEVAYVVDFGQNGLMDLSNKGNEYYARVVRTAR